MLGIRKKIILVDDLVSNLDQGRNILKTFYEVIPASSAAKMFEVLDKVVPDLILLDIEMPEMDGYEAIKKLKSDNRFTDIPVIFLTSKTDAESEREGFDLGAVEYITKPFSPPLLLKRIENHLLFIQEKKALKESEAALMDNAQNMEEIIKDKVREILDLQNAVLVTVADLVEFRDKHTGGHITRTKLYLKSLLDVLISNGIYQDMLNKWNLDDFLASAPLHDVGKIAIPDQILNKPGRHTPEEFEIMKGHVSASVDAIEKIMNNTHEHAFLRHALAIAGTHHEKWDGKGYPIGLRGQNIPLEGRLMAVADVYDALISVRPYKKAFTHVEACKMIEDGSGTQFDPVLIDAFRKAESEFARIAKENEG